jgi:hypothetical protein
MRVQRVLMPGSEAESWTLLGETCRWSHMLHPRSASQLGPIRSRQPRSNPAEQALSRFYGPRVDHKINLDETPRLGDVRRLTAGDTQQFGVHTGKYSVCDLSNLTSFRYPRARRS